MPCATVTVNVGEEEPVAIQFTNQGSDIVKSFTSEETSQIFAELNSNTSSFNSLVLKNNAEFEVYQPKTSTELHNNSTGTKLERDYSFRIKFRDKDSNFYIKEYAIATAFLFILIDKTQIVLTTIKKDNSLQLALDDLRRRLLEIPV